MARIKEIDIYGQKFIIASLTLEQVEELFPASKAEQEALKARPAEAQDRVFRTICYGLNNADASHSWDKTKVKRELDMITFGELHMAILRHSGLAKEEDTPGAPVGEKKAVPIM